MSSVVLPVELIFKIVEMIGSQKNDFGISETETIKTLSLVSRNVRKVALKYLFSHLTLKIGSNLTRLFLPYLMKNVTDLTIQAISEEIPTEVQEAWIQGIKNMNVKRLTINLPYATEIPQTVYHAFKSNTLELVVLNPHYELPAYPDVPDTRKLIVNGGDLHEPEFYSYILSSLNSLESIYLDPAPNITSQEWLPYYDKIVHLNLHIDPDHDDVMTRYVSLIDKHFPKLVEVTLQGFTNDTVEERLIYNWICEFPLKRLNLVDGDIEILFRGHPPGLKQISIGGCSIVANDLDLDDRMELLDLLETIPQRFIETQAMNDASEWTRELRRLNNWIPVDD